MDPRAFSGASPPLSGGAGSPGLGGNPGVGPTGLGAPGAAFPPGPVSAPLRMAPLQSTLTFSRFSRAVNPSSKTE